jgi:hypothetical protein
MAKDYLRKNKFNGAFSGRRIAMLESPAFQVLSQSAHRVLCRLEIEHAHHAGNDNGKLPVTYEHFEEYGIHRQSIAPAIREPVALGFIEVTEAGRAGCAEFKRPNLFRLTYRYLARAEPTEEWERIKTVEEAELIAQNARRSPSKNRTPVVDSVNSQYGNQHRKPDFHSTDSTTRGHSTDSTTTSIFLPPKGETEGAPPLSLADIRAVMERRAARSPSKRAGALARSYTADKQTSR